MKKIVLGVILFVVLLVTFGCTEQNTAALDNSNSSSTQCPASLQACGSGCIPTNAICCDKGTINGYCLQPTTTCGNGTCNQCPSGQAFCGMFCKPIGEKCCIGTCPDNNSSPENVSPTIKIKSATAKFKQVISPQNGGFKEADSCTVELSGTATGTTCAILDILSGTQEAGSLLEIGGAKACPGWTYLDTSGICVHKLKQPTTINWNMTQELTFYKGSSRVFTVELSVPKTPLPKLDDVNPSCVEAETASTLTDSVTLTCE